MTGSAVPASVVIASRHRPRYLLRALTAVAQLDHPAVEVVVVADPEAALAVDKTGLAVKLVSFDEPNLSAARNLGLSRAAAPVTAFLDDDAVPEPTWLSRLVAPFGDPRVEAAGGFVRGRSGFAWQWRAMEVTTDGFDRPTEVPPDVSLHAGSAERAMKLQGTNMAFRTERLRALGGFDPAFRFYLDDADMCLRLAGSGGLTAIVPDAVVHHAFAASDRRRRDRAPLDLFEIGRSLALFLRRHAAPDPERFVALHRAAERRRALRHMVAGRLEPRDVGRLLRSFDAGIAEGTGLPLGPLPALSPDDATLLCLPGTGMREGTVVSGRASQRAQLEAEAAAARRTGRIVTLIAMRPGLARHRMEFGEDGVWRQTGGLWGRSERTEELRVLPFALRTEREVARLATVRPTGG